MNDPCAAELGLRRERGAEVLRDALILLGHGEGWLAADTTPRTPSPRTGCASVPPPPSTRRRERGIPALRPASRPRTTIPRPRDGRCSRSPTPCGRGGWRRTANAAEIPRPRPATVRAPAPSSPPSATPRPASPPSRPRSAGPSWIWRPSRDRRRDAHPAGVPAVTGHSRRTAGAALASAAAHGGRGSAERSSAQEGVCRSGRR